MIDLRLLVEYLFYFATKIVRSKILSSSFNLHFSIHVRMSLVKSTIPIEFSFFMLTLFSDMVILLKKILLNYSKYETDLCLHTTIFS